MTFDINHLRQFTGGDEDLELEVLELFLENGEKYLALIAAGGDEKSWRTAAHSLKGSARSIGAIDVERAAADVEASETPQVAIVAEAFAACRLAIQNHMVEVRSN